MVQTLRKLSDVIDEGQDITGRHIIFHMEQDAIFVVERVENGRPISVKVNSVPFTKTYLDTVSRDTHTSYNMLKAEYTRYSTGGLYPDYLMNLLVLKIEGALDLLFGSAISSGAKPIV